MLDQAILERNDTELEGWLLDKVAAYVRQPRGSIRPDTPLTEYGLDSVYALTLVGDIEDHLGLSLDPTVMWDFPTVHALTAELIRVKRQTPSHS
jgi:acyl carrier protein